MHLNRGKNRRFKFILYKTNKKYYEVSTLYDCVGKLSMIIGRMLQLSKFVWTLRSSV